jgi:uncharacterized protein with von Willebrand factor type A (vWA) domain
MLIYRYSRWDGTQEVFELHQDDLMEALSDELIEHGDILRALRNLARGGLTGRFGGKLPGLQELLERLRQRRSETLDRYDLGSAVQELRTKLDQIIDKERSGIKRRLEEAQRQFEETGESEEGLRALERVAEKNQSFLDNLPKDLGGAIKELYGYDFIDDEARQEFEELMETLKKHVMDSTMKDLHQQLQGLTPQDMDRFRDMLQQLNQMLREKGEGGQPDFDNFMNQFGNVFGDQRPQSLEELMEMFQERMAQTQSLMESLSPQDRQSLQDLLNSLVDQHGLREELEKLAYHMAELSPVSEHSQYPFQGEESLSLSEALRLMEQLRRMDQLEKQLSSTRWGNPLEDIDSEQVRELLGEEAYQALEQWRRMLELLEDSGYIQRKGQRLELTPRAIRKLGQKALQDVFSYLKKDRQGRHDISKSGAGGDLSDETKDYEYGDPFFLQLERTLMNSLHREGPGTPLKMEAEDFEVFRTEQTTRCATVLLIDMSLSMPMRGNFLAAKKMVLALESLIRTQYPQDALYIVGFSDYARELKSEVLAQFTWNEYVYGTNMHHAFILARRLLSRHKFGNRQVIMVTDGEPTAHLEGNVAYFDYPPHPRTLQLTLLEAKRCAQDRIVINTFMLDRSYYLIQFIDQLTKLNRGRAFYTSSEKLGQYVIVDYLTNKRSRISS